MIWRSDVALLFIFTICAVDDLVCRHLLIPAGKTHATMKAVTYTSSPPSRSLYHPACCPSPVFAFVGAATSGLEPANADIVDQGAILVHANRSAQPRGAVSCCSILCPQHSVAINRAVDGLYAQGCVLFPGVGYVYAHTLIQRSRFSFADDKLLDLAILSEVFRTTESQ